MLRWMVLLLFAFQSGHIAAADGETVARSVGGSAITVTRFFRQIELLEQQTGQALAANDKHQLNQLLSPVFVLQKADGSLAGKDALSTAGIPTKSLRLAHLHEVGNVLIAIVKVDGSRESVMTDIWQSVEGTNWQLRLRILPK